MRKCLGHNARGCASQVVYEANDIHNARPGTCKFFFAKIRMVSLPASEGTMPGRRFRVRLLAVDFEMRIVYRDFQSRALARLMAHIAYDDWCMVSQNASAGALYMLLVVYNAICCCRAGLQSQTGAVIYSYSAQKMSLNRDIPYRCQVDSHDGCCPWQVFKCLRAKALAHAIYGLA